MPNHQTLIILQAITSQILSLLVFFVNENKRIRTAFSKRKRIWGQVLKYKILPATVDKPEQKQHSQITPMAGPPCAAHVKRSLRAY
jgi:hypothetical protein